MERDVYSGWLRLNGEEDEKTLNAANNYADSLRDLQHFEEARSLLRRTMPVARRVFGENHDLTLTMRWNYARALSEDPAATHGDLREAVNTLEDAGRTVRRVLSGAHPLAAAIEEHLRNRERRSAPAKRRPNGRRPPEARAINPKSYIHD